MGLTEPPLKETIWQEDPFNFISPSEFEALGINPEDIPAGTFAAFRHPSYLPSRFGGNAYGCGFFEVYDHLDTQDAKSLQRISLDDPEQVKDHVEGINRIYKQIGLLIRFSRHGKPYYLIPDKLVFDSLTNIRVRAQEISKVIEFHRKKYLKESLQIGLITHGDDLIISDLSLRFKEHEFIPIDALEKLRFLNTTMDLIIMTRDIHEIIFMEKFSPSLGEKLTKRRLENYASYIMGKVYSLLKPDGEILIIANCYPTKSNQTIKVTFKTEQEEKQFILFSHLFKTKKRYKSQGKPLQIYVSDLHRYLSGPYVERDILDKLLGVQELETMTLKKINTLPYLNLPLEQEQYHDQKKSWPKILSVYFNEILFKSMIPDAVKAEWKKRFSASGYTPDHMILYLGQKRAPITTLSHLKSDIMETRLAGCPVSLLAKYRNSFGYLTETLEILNRIKSGQYDVGLPEIFMERLKQPFENKKRRYTALNDVIKLMSKINRLHRIQDYLNPDRIEGLETKVIENLERLPFFGFNYGELREIFLIVVGHTTLGRVLAGKMSEKTLKPVSDLARRYDPQQAINLLRYCRLMIVAETVASRKTDMNEEQLAELFDLFESMVRVVINREMDWDRLIDEKISAMGGIHYKIVRKTLKMMNHFRFLSSWEELGQKGGMEKESLADYDEEELRKIESVIRLIDTIDRFENDFLRDDPLQSPTFYRKFLNMEFHGTGHLFEKMDSSLVFILLWITLNVARGEVINFNPILVDLEAPDLNGYIKKVEEEAESINRNYLDLNTLHTLSEQLYENQTTFILGTGFQLRVNPETSALDIHYIDMDENISKLDALVKKYSGIKISEIPEEVLDSLERWSSNLENFYQSHLRILSQKPTELKLPLRQRRWFDEAKRLGQEILSNLRSVIFNPESIYSDLILLYGHSRSLLKSVLPELTALSDLTLQGKIYIKSPLIHHVLNSTKKIQALINRDRSDFQDIALLRKLAQREFGPMAPGIIGLSDHQIESLERIVESLRAHRPLFEALIQSFIFRDVGLIPKLRERYRDQINPVDHARAGSHYLELEGIPARYSDDPKIHQYLGLLVAFHDRLQHIVRGEFSHGSLQEVIDYKDKALFDAFFVTSFIMFSAIKEDLMLEDLATRLFETRELCLRIIEGETSLEDYLADIYIQRGELFYALEAYHEKGWPQGVSASNYLDSWKGNDGDKSRYLQAGKMIRAVERILRLRGIRYVEFIDLANLMGQVPLQFIFKKRGYSGIGYATFERELFEALRIYNGLQKLPESTRHFILSSLVADKVRIFGFENVSAFMSYENMIRLLLLALLGAQTFKETKGPVCLDFLALAADINKRYEAVNETLSQISLEKLWDNATFIHQLFKTKTGIHLEKDESPTQKVLTIHFIDKINISHKKTYMETIKDVEQLKNYYHYSLRSLRKNPFYTEDYEHELEKTYDRRLREITDLILDQTKRQVELLTDVKEIYGVVVDMNDRALDIGFTDEQRLRLMDLYELRKDTLKREKLHEIDTRLETIQEMEELKDYWDSIKWYLLNNRKYLGKEFEHLIAKKFDDHMRRLAS